jgi:hypothetical protein
MIEKTVHKNIMKAKLFKYKRNYYRTINSQNAKISQSNY